MLKRSKLLAIFLLLFIFLSGCSSKCIDECEKCLENPSVEECPECDITKAECDELFPCPEAPLPTEAECDELYPPELCEECPEDPQVEPVKLGIDNIDQYLEYFEGKRVGLITNQTGFNSEFRSTIDILYEKTNLTALFAPEHGIRGNVSAGGSIATYVDEATGLNVYSLYGSTTIPTAEMMNQIDVMCVDIQDVGARFYTYVYTMANAMKACTLYDKEFVVFDRPNPVGGEAVQGNILDMSYSSFIGMYPIVQRHGMTIGEIAKLFVLLDDGIDIDVKVVPMTGWKRDMYYDETNLPWIPPSPNIPTIETAVVYTATCIFEGTNFSEGRGTQKPFEMIGAPYVNAEEYAKALNNLNLPGVYFTPTYFTPTSSKNSGVLCYGVLVHVTDRTTFESVKTGWAMIEVARDLYPEDFVVLGNKERCSMDLLSGNNYLRLRTYSLSELFDIIDEDTEEFLKLRNECLIYD